MHEPSANVQLLLFSFHSAFGRECPGPSFRTDFSDESRLINCLLAKYARVSTLTRPVQDSSANVVVDFGVSLIQILDFDEIKQVLTTSMWKNYVSTFSAEFDSIFTFLMQQVAHQTLLWMPH